MSEVDVIPALLTEADIDKIMVDTGMKAEPDKTEPEPVPEPESGEEKAATDKDVTAKPDDAADSEPGEPLQTNKGFGQKVWQELANQRKEFERQRKESEEQRKQISALLGVLSNRSESGTPSAVKEQSRLAGIKAQLSDPKFDWLEKGPQLLRELVEDVERSDAQNATQQRMRSESDQFWNQFEADYPTIGAVAGKRLWRECYTRAKATPSLPESQWDGAAHMLLIQVATAAKKKAAMIRPPENTSKLPKTSGRGREALKGAVEVNPNPGSGRSLEDRIRAGEFELANESK